MTRDTVEADLFGRLFLLGQHLGRYADEALVPYGVTSRQWLLLAVLARGFAGEQPTLTQAAAAYGSSRQNVKQIATQLAARGLVELLPDASDRRATRLALTDRVTELFDEPAAAAEQRTLIAGVFADLGDDEVIQLGTLVRRCIATLEREHERENENENEEPTP